ncbi:hypothetical protein Y600_5983 [Burkholderia pseudomallei MSHR3709]|nr:hypothetical protein Y600_5983 [Burkholderia pseudomallei MSHR3709]
MGKLAQMVQLKRYFVLLNQILAQEYVSLHLLFTLLNPLAPMLLPNDSGEALKHLGNLGGINVKGEHEKSMCSMSRALPATPLASTTLAA